MSVIMWYPLTNVVLINGRNRSVVVVVVVKAFLHGTTGSRSEHTPQCPPAGDATTHRGTTNLELQLQQAFYTDNSQWRTVHITDTFINTDQCFFSWQFYYSFSFHLVNESSRICIVVVTMMKVMYFLSKDIFVLITIEHRIGTHCDKMD